MKRVSENPYGWRFWYVVFSIACSVYAFLSNTALLESYQESLIKEYFDFTRTIYQPQTTYLAESILLPWIGFLMGAGKHWLFYKLLCSFATILSVPAIAYFAMKYFDHPLKAWAFLLIFLATYRNIWGPYYIGMPDPLTVVLLVAISFERRPLAVFFLTTLAAVTHFSITFIAIFCFMALLICSKANTKEFKVATIKYAVLGLVVGKLLLAIWFYRFKYQLTTRIDYVTDLGLMHFVDRYLADVIGYWLTPGWPFLIMFFFLVFWAIKSKQRLLPLMMFAAITLAYIALFFTRDGLRVFAVTIVGAYVFMIKEFIDQIFARWTQKPTEQPHRTRS